MDTAKMILMFTAASALVGILLAALVEILRRRGVISQGPSDWLANMFAPSGAQAAPTA